MGKEKRKTRLNKAEKGDFIGFSAFASGASASVQSLSGTNPAAATAPSVILTPIYLGNVPELTIVFQRLGQKKDSITKTKALQELKAFFQDETHTKKAQIDALAHFIHVYHGKIHYDTAPSVRAESLLCFDFALKRVPKAFRTLASQQSEILGMLFCSQTDPAADVRIASTSLSETLGETYANQKESIEDGLWEYVKRITTYGKPRVMHDALFAKKNEASLSESQLEDLEEKFERVVGIALDGFRLWAHKRETDVDGTKTADFIYKSLTSAQSSVRRKGYSLLATMCQKTPSLLINDKTDKLLFQSLASEKDALCIPGLFEALLSFFAHLSVDARRDKACQYNKPLNKILKRGCYGASASRWAPSLLPIVATLADLDMQATMLASALEGADHVVTASNELEVKIALTETATYVLRKKSNLSAPPPAPDENDGAGGDDQSPVEAAKKVANIFLRCMEHVLCMTSTGITKRFHDKLIKLVALNLDQLDQLVEGTAFSTISDWFWSQGINEMMANSTDTKDASLTQFVVEVSKVTETNPESQESSLRFFLTEALRTRFRSTLKQYDHSVPTEQVYQLLIAILKYSNVDKIFSGNSPDDDIQRFVMNDLLRWMVVHSSTISDSKSTQGTVTSFMLFGLCQSKSSETLPWNAVLRELLIAKCDIRCLHTGIQTILKMPGSFELVKCPILDDLCTSIGLPTIDDTENGAREDAIHSALDSLSNEDAEHFLGMIIGHENSRSSLISYQVVESWINRCPNRATSFLQYICNEAVLSSLLKMIKTGDIQLDQSDRILLQAWRQGGSCWAKAEDFCLQTQNRTVLIQLIDGIKTELRESLDALLENDLDSSAARSSVVTLWSIQVIRLFNLRKRCEEIETTLDTLTGPLLSQVGVPSLHIWQAWDHARKLVLVDSIIEVLKCLESKDERSKVIFEMDGALDFLLEMLLSVSEGGTDFFRTKKVRSRSDACAYLLSMLEDFTMQPKQVVEFIQLCTQRLSQDMEKRADDETLAKGVAVVSQVVDEVFHIENERPIAEANFELGQKVWYLTNKDDPHGYEPAKIIKVHDDVEQSYFTIELSRGDSTEEKQTVSERLKIRETNTSVEAAESEPGLDSNEMKVEGVKSSQKIIQTLILPYRETLPLPLAELLSITTSKCGYGEQKGIGSLQYDVISLLSSMQQNLIQSLTTSDSSSKPVVTATLWRLNLILGFGLNVPASPINTQLLKFDPSPSLRAIVESYEVKVSDGETSVSTSVNYDGASTSDLKATLVWLSLALPAIEWSELTARGYHLLFTLASEKFETRCETGQFTLEHYFALRAMLAASADKSLYVEAIPNSCHESRERATVGMIRAFAASWKTAASAEMVVEVENGSSFGIESWEPLLRSTLMNIFKGDQRLLRVPCNKCTNDLVKTLFVADKQSLSLQLLHYRTMIATPFMELDDVEFGDERIEQIQRWGTGLSTEEVDELREDVAVAVQWFPEEMMSQVESWSDDVEGTDEFATCSKMLLWLYLLEIVDRAAQVESSNRQVLTSYIGKTHAVGTVLNWMLRWAAFLTEKNNIKNRKSLDLQKLMENPELCTIADLSELLLFRTIEVFPTLSKHWWEMDCPKVYVSRIKEFVVVHISPALLQREVTRLRMSGFGQMNVTSSAVSREITATYEKDDFKLSVVINLPEAFPFRNPEVDCSKTYGVPETRWKKWSLQIKMMLNNQGGTLRDALHFWQKNVDKEFEGVEPCPVCYSILHVKTHKLPHLECNICHYRFHSDCLTQWFRSSGKNACVTCQQPWSGTRVQ